MGPLEGGAIRWLSLVRVFDLEMRRVQVIVPELRKCPVHLRSDVCSEQLWGTHRCRWALNSMEFRGLGRLGSTLSDWALQSRIPSMMDAWFSLAKHKEAPNKGHLAVSQGYASEITASSGPRQAWQQIKAQVFGTSGLKLR